MQRERQRHRQREKQASFRESDVGLDPRTLGSQLESKVRLFKGSLSGSAVKRLPSAQGVILESWDQVPHPAPCMKPASPSACVSTSLSLSLSLSLSVSHE